MSVSQAELGPLAVAWKKESIEIDPPVPPDAALKPPERSNRLELRLKNISGRRLTFNRSGRAPEIGESGPFPDFSRIYLTLPVGSGSKYFLTGDEARRVKVSANTGWEVLAGRAEAGAACWMLCAGQEGGAYLQKAGLDDDKGSILVTFDQLPAWAMEEAFSVLTLESRDIYCDPSGPGSGDEDDDDPRAWPDARCYLPVMKKYRPPVVLMDHSPKNAGRLDKVRFTWLCTSPVLRARFLPDPEGDENRLVGQTGQMEYTLTENLNFALRADFTPGRYGGRPEPDPAEEAPPEESLYQRLSLTLPEPEIIDLKAVRCQDAVYVDFAVLNTRHVYLNHGRGRVECEGERTSGGGRSLMTGRAVLRPVTASPEGVVVTLTCLGSRGLIRRDLVGDPGNPAKDFLPLNIFFQMNPAAGRDRCDYLIDWSLGDLRTRHGFENLGLRVEKEGRAWKDLLSDGALAGYIAFREPPPELRLRLTGENTSAGWRLNLVIPPLVIDAR